MPDIGPHLLGRIPSEHDGRNFPLAAFMRGPISPEQAKLAAAYVALSHSHLIPPSLREWARLATNLLIGATPPAPTPPAPPTPTPAPPAPPAPPQPTPTPAPGGADGWADTEQLDQGNTGHCVGFGWAGWGNCLPVDDHYTDADGHAIYYEAKVIDGEPRQEDGSSALSGAKAMRSRGRLAAYAAASTLQEAQDWLLGYGPLCVGTDWTEGMFNPDANGVIHPTGAVAGGHCYLLTRYNPALNQLTIKNSWGTGWGVNGYAFIDATEWWRLYQSNGEMWTGVELAVA